MREARGTLPAIPQPARRLHLRRRRTENRHPRGRPHEPGVQHAQPTHAEQRFPADRERLRAISSPTISTIPASVSRCRSSTRRSGKRKIRREAYDGQQAALTVYKRELVKDIRSAYYNFLRADQALSIYTNAEKLLQDNRRLTETLVGNGPRAPLQPPPDRCRDRKERSRTRRSGEQPHQRAALPQLPAQPSTWIRHRHRQHRPSRATAGPNSTAAIVAGKNSRNSKAGIKSEPIPRAHETRLPAPDRQYLSSTRVTRASTTVRRRQQYYLGGVQLRWNLFAGMTNTAGATSRSRTSANSNQNVPKPKAARTQTCRAPPCKTAQAQATGAEAQERFPSEYYRQTLSATAKAKALVRTHRRVHPMDQQPVALNAACEPTHPPGRTRTRTGRLYVLINQLLP